MAGSHPAPARGAAGGGEELRRLLAEHAPAAGTAPAVTQHATASGHARALQAGRDQHITGR
ncbi:hypothetical protein [Streptomyces albidoflavus]|uniref:hypothetical protein n=1 Tax=Streptomyces albidoflavus TaxID=1886 RepID=UPI000A756279